MNDIDACANRISIAKERIARYTADLATICNFLEKDKEFTEMQRRFLHEFSVYSTALSNHINNEHLKEEEKDG